MIDHDAVVQAIADELNLDPLIVTPDAKLDDDLGADSLDISSLEIDLEDLAGHVIDLSECKTVQDIVDACGILT